MVVAKRRTDVTGDKHPSKRAYRELYREPPERLVVAVESWRRRVKPLLRAIGNPSVVEVWRGPSRLNGEPIVVLASRLQPTQKAAINPKTGDMVQLYILPADHDPASAAKSGEGDGAVCGSCLHRPTGAMGDCYVRVSWAPRNLWLAWRRGDYPPMPEGLLAGALIRFGAWGDPAAVPVEVWEPLVAGAVTYTGYTQEWPALDSARWGWLMASVIGDDELLAARDQGWRTFRTVYDGDAEIGEVEGERECLATAKHVPCIGCGGCGGNNQPSRPSYALRAHGQRHPVRR